MNLEGHGNGEIGPDPLIIQNQEVVVVNAGRDRSLADVHQVMFDHHLRLSGNKANGLLIEIT